MFLPASSSLPLLPPPFTSILSTHYPSSPTNTIHDQFSHNQPPQRRSHPNQSNASSLRNPSSLHNLLLDESAISSRKAAISTYGYSWLRPAGVAKTMLGRREEEAEREELERQLREQEEMELEMERGEELARQATLREQQQQQQQGAGGNGEVVEQRNLDDDIPDANEGPVQHEHDVAGEGEPNLDDEIPDADAENSFADEDDDEDDDDDDNIEGETGITDEVEHTSLGLEEDVPPHQPALPNTIPLLPNNRNTRNPNTHQLSPHATQAAQQIFRRREQEQQQQQQQQAEQEALANAMLEEDEQALADRDLDAEIPTEDDENARDLDADIPEANLDDDDDEYDNDEGEGEWQHTDTELDLDENSAFMMSMEDEEEQAGGDVSMEMSLIDGHGRRSITTAAAAGNILTTPAPASVSAAVEGSSMLQTQTPASSGDLGNAGGDRRWLTPRSLSGRGRTGNLFAGIMGRGVGSGSPHAPPQAQSPMDASLAQEQGQGAQQQHSRRRSGRRGFGRENRSARESLD